jgi:REP element-mobilizing transposase RayT
MSHDFQISHDNQALFITLNTQHRLPVFQKPELDLVLCSALDEARKTADLLLFAYVFMIDHIHLVTNQPKPPSEILRVIKGTTAHRVIEYLKENNYASSLAKLKHADRGRNHHYSLWQTEKMSIRFLARVCLCRRSITFIISGEGGVG